MTDLSLSWRELLSCRVGLDGVPGELVLDVVEKVANGVLVLELVHTAINLEQDLVELDCQLEQNSHEAVSVQWLEERPHLKTIILVLSLLYPTPSEK